MNNVHPFMKFSFIFIMLMVVLNSIVYGVIIYSMWDDLGKRVDDLSTGDCLFPLGVTTVFSAIATLIQNIIDDDW